MRVPESQPLNRIGHFLDNKNIYRYVKEMEEGVRMGACVQYRVALFGEAEKGQFRKAHPVQELPQLMDLFGNPPEGSQGIAFAIQALLFKRKLIYFRVEEEGFSIPDYLFGLRYLKNGEKTQDVRAICLPGLGEQEILHASEAVCRLRSSFLILTQKDLYDYLTSA